jgi:hypothetical protein
MTARLSVPALLLALAATPATAQDATPETPYLDFKGHLQDDYNLSYNVVVSMLPQFGVQPGDRPIVSMLLAPSITWNPLNDTPFGDGELTASIVQAQYFTGANAVTLQTTLGVNSAPNDFTYNQLQRMQLMWTQKLPGGILEVTVGQYQFSGIDANVYASNQQVNFINFGLTQTSSQTYPAAGLGGFAKLNLPKGFALYGGLQNAEDVNGLAYTAGGFSRHNIAWFAAAEWTGDIPTLGGGKYTLFGYHQPSVADQPGASHGLSFNAAQRLGDKWAAFLLANQANGAVLGIQAAIGGGVIRFNPWGLNDDDQLGMGLSWNRTNKNAFPNEAVRASEIVAETYANFTLVPSHLLAGPDIQIYPNPALKPHAGAAAVLSLRATATF